MSVKEQAEVYRRGLLLGLFPVADVITWCDSVISDEPAPDIGLIEASIAGSRGVNAVADSLSGVEGDFSEVVVVAALFRSMLNVLDEGGGRATTVARWLSRMAQEGQVPDEEAECEMINFAEYIYLANEGIYGYLEEATNEMRSFLEKYAGPEFVG